MTFTDQHFAPQAKDCSLPFIRGRSLMILALLCVAQFIYVLQFQSVTLVLPAIQHSLGFSSELLQWVVNANVLAFAGGLLVAGRLADLFGHRRLFLCGLMLSAPGSLLSGFALSPVMLIVGRIIQGASSAMMIPAALALLIDMFPKEAQRRLALGIWGVAGPVGGITGTVLGTLITDTFGWPWIFFLTVPLAVVALLLSLKMLPDVGEPASSARVDIGGALLSTGSIVLFIAALTQIVHPTGSWLIPLSLLAGSLVSLLLFCLLELRLTHPLVPLHVLLRPQIASASLVTLAYSAATNTPIFFFTLYVQQVRGFSSFLTGLAFLPTNLMLLCGSFLCAKIIRWVGAKTATVGGLVMVAVSAFLFTHLSVAGEYTWILLPGLLLLGGGLGIVQVAVMVIGTAHVPISERGLASSLISMASQVGTALGLAVLASLANLRSTILTGHTQPSQGDLVVGFQWAFDGVAIFAVLSILLATFIMKKAHA